MNTVTGVRAVVDQILITLRPRRPPLRVVDEEAGSWELRRSRPAASAVLADVTGVPTRAQLYRPAHGPLSVCDWQVVDLLRAGLTTERIAEELIISVAAARALVERLMVQLGVASRGELVGMTAGLYADA